MDVLNHSGNVFVLSAPSGTGKSTLAKRLVKEVEGLEFSVSFTTRAPREGEVHGRDYFFVNDETFDRMVAEDGFVEWVQVYRNRYGTGKAWLLERLASGCDILLDIETVGARNVHAAISDAVMVFLMPPSGEELARRLRGRTTESEEQIALRLGHARHEMAQFPHYDHLIINDTVDQAFRDLEAVVLAKRSSRERMNGRAQAILDGFR